MGIGGYFNGVQSVKQTNIYTTMVRLKLPDGFFLEILPNSHSFYQ